MTGPLADFASKPGSARSPSRFQAVSRAAFTVRGERAATSVIREAVAWIRRRAGAPLSDAAFSGTPFDTGIGAPSPAFAVTAHIDGAQYWASRLRDSDKNVAGRTWHSEIVVRDDGASADLVVRLAQMSTGENPDFRPTLPGCVQQFVDSCSAWADERRLVMEPCELSTDEGAFEDFCALVVDGQRRLPVLAVSTLGDDEYALDVNRLASRLAGAAHVFLLSEDFAWELTKRLGKAWSVYWGAARLYWGGCDPGRDDPYRHPLWFARDLEEFGDPQTAADSLAGVLLTQALRNGSRDSTLPRAEDLKRLAIVAEAQSRHVSTVEAARASRDMDTVDREQREMINELRGEIVVLRKRIEDDENAAEELLSEIEEKHLVELAFGRHTKEQLDVAVAHLEVAKETLRRNKIPFDRPLTSYNEIEEWAADVLGGRVVLLERAVKGIQRHGTPDIKDRIAHALCCLRDFYDGGENGANRHFQDLRQRLLSQSMEERECLTNEGDYDRFSGYKVSYNGKTCIMNRHVKYGDGRDLRSGFRMYFFWDPHAKRVVVGDMPKHLRDNNTD